MVYTLGLCVCFSAVATVRATNGHLFPSTTEVASDVQWRQLDSFWKANGSHVDLYNVVVDGHTLSIYLPDDAAAARVRDIFSHFQDPNTLPPYSKATRKLDNFRVVFENTFLDPTTCDVQVDGSTFLDSPWYHNVYHTHAKNMIPMAAVLLTTPPLIKGAGRCTSLPCARQLKERHLIHHFHPGLTQRMITRVHRALFTDIKTLDDIRDSGRRHCFRHLSWGPGTEMFAVNGYQDYYVREGRVAMTALRKFALKTFLPDAAPKMSDKNQRSAEEPLRALWISRQPKDNVGQVQTGRNRWIQNPDELKTAFESFPNVEVVECCDWNHVTMADMMDKISTADIVYGLHGAGLANALYARKGVKLVEIVGNYGGDSNFYTRVASARYGDWIRVVVPHSNYVPTRLVQALAACSVALWRQAKTVATQSYYPPPPQCNEPGLEVVRTTVEIKHEDPKGERLPLDIEFAPCKASPRCRIQALGPGGGLRMMGIEVDEHGKPVIGPDGKWKKAKGGPLLHEGEDDPPPLRPRTNAHTGLL